MVAKEPPNQPPNPCGTKSAASSWAGGDGQGQLHAVKYNLSVNK